MIDSEKESVIDRAVKAFISAVKGILGMFLTLGKTIARQPKYDAAIELTIDPTPITTTDTFEGKRIVRYLGIACGLSTKDQFDKPFDVIRSEAIEQLKSNAKKLGANAVIGMRFDSQFVEAALCSQTYGTAVIVEDIDSDESTTKRREKHNEV